MFSQGSKFNWNLQDKQIRETAKWVSQSLNYDVLQYEVRANIALVPWYPMSLSEASDN